MISSLSNQNVKYVRRLQTDRRFRHREQSYIVEGTRWLRELSAFQKALKYLYYSEDWVTSADNQQILAQFGGSRQCVSNEVMKAMSATEAAPGILAIVAMQSLQIPPQPSLMIILDGIADPGNLGTILRTSVATGVEAALLGPGCVDVYNPKVVRGAMGAHLRLPVYHLDWEEISTIVAGIPVYLADSEGDLTYTDVDWVRPSTLIIGNEAHGGSEEARSLASNTIAIPMHDGAESLNAAVAASVILFETVRQRGLSKNSRLANNY